jgi:signal transduction histidine kinase
VALLLIFGAVVFLQVRADRLRDLDASLAASAGALSGYIEYDHGWELDEIPPFVTAPLAGFEVRAGGETLRGDGVLEGRTWSGEFEVESDALPHNITVTVAADLAPLRGDLLALLAELGAAGLVLSGLSVGLGSWLSRRIVASEDFQRLQAAWERQAAFTADASHELRTPLAVIRARAEVALRRPRSPEQYREALEDVLGSAGRMQELLEGLLVLARAGERVERRPVDLAAVARAAVAEARAPEGVRLEAALPEAAAMVGDARLLRVLVDNLVVNALRHTREGAVVVALEAAEGAWRLEVRDTGEGIAPEHLGRIFERFYRVDPGRSRTDGGGGLGLSIVQAIAAQHGGRVTARSVLGEGTVMTAVFPW